MHKVHTRIFRNRNTQTHTLSGGSIMTAFISVFLNIVRKRSLKQPTHILFIKAMYSSTHNTLQTILYLAGHTVRGVNPDG